VLSQALQAVALYRLGKSLEALQIILAFKPDPMALGDADVLHFAGWILSALGRNVDNLELFDAACKRHQGNEDVCVESICHFIRAREWKRIQQLAMKMHKSFGVTPSSSKPIGDDESHNKYLWWSVMSMILQAGEPSNRPSVPLLLSLCDRLISEVNAPEEPAPQFYIRAKVLYLRATATLTRPQLSADSITETFETLSFSSWSPQSLPDDSKKARQQLLDLFRSPRGETLCDQNLGLELWRREVQLALGVADDWQAGLELSRKLLVDGGDTNWATILGLIHFSMKLQRSLPKSLGEGGSEGKQGPATTDDLVSHAGQILRKLADNGERPSKERGFQLGLLELVRLLRRVGSSSEGLLSLS
jgi:hypothetical protein